MLTVVQENGSKKAWDECHGDWLHMIKILWLKTIALQIDQLDQKKEFVNNNNKNSVTLRTEQVTNGF